MEDDVQGHDELLLVVGEQTLTPNAELSCNSLELMIEDVQWLCVSGDLVPSRAHNVVKPWHLRPEVLETEGWRLARATMVG